MAFEELKERHAAMWGSAPFERIAGTLADMHAAIVAAGNGAPGRDWLDVGCGTGELAFMAAATGATVTGADLSPVLIETARRQAAERGADVTFEVGDAEALPYPDGGFDIVTSSVGAIFAPDHRAVASELARICRPGGNLALSAWTSGGVVDEFFQIIGSYAPPPPPGAGIAASWGEPGYAEGLLGDDFELDHHAARHALGGRDRPGDVVGDVRGVRPDQDAARGAPPGAGGGLQGRAARVLRG